MSKVKKMHGTAYMLAHISRSLCSSYVFHKLYVFSIQENAMIVPMVAQVRNYLSYPIEFPSDSKSIHWL